MLDNWFIKNNIVAALDLLQTIRLEQPRPGSSGVMRAIEKWGQDGSQAIRCHFLPYWTNCNKVSTVRRTAEWSGGPPSFGCAKGDHLDVSGNRLQNRGAGLVHLPRVFQL